MPLEEKDLIHGLEQKIIQNDELAEKFSMKAQYHKDLAFKYRNAIKVIKGESIEAGPLNLAKTPQSMKFGTAIKHLLNLEMKALTSTELLEKYNKFTGKDLDLKTFSGMLSNQIKKDGQIKKIEIPENAMSYRYYYGIKSWYQEEENEDK